MNRTTNAVLLCIAAATLLLGAVSCGTTNTDDAAPQGSKLLAMAIAEPANHAETDQMMAEHIELCMRARGFDYNPPPRATVDAATTRLSDLEYATTFGFGLVASPDSQAQPSQDTEQEFSSAHEGDAFSVALSNEYGCADEAFQEVFGPMQSRLESLMAPIEEIESRISADADFIRASDSLSTCLAKAGHEHVRSRDDLYNRFAAEMESVLAHAVTNETVEDQAVSSDHLAAIMNSSVVVDFAERERSAAVALVRCETEHLVPVYAELYEKYEQAVLVNYPDLDIT